LKNEKKRRREDRHAIFLEDIKKEGKKNNYWRQITLYPQLRAPSGGKERANALKDTVKGQVWLPGDVAHAT